MEVLQNQPSEPISAQSETYVEESSELLSRKSQELSQDIKERYGHLFLNLEYVQCPKQMHWWNSRWASIYIQMCIWSSFRRCGCVHLETMIWIQLLCLIWSKIFVSHTLLVLLWGRMSHSQLRTRGENSWKNISVSEPEEHILDKKEGKTFQYVTLLPSLLHVLSKAIQDKTFECGTNIWKQVSDISWWISLSENVFFLSVRGQSQFYLVYWWLWSMQSSWDNTEKAQSHCCKLGVGTHSSALAIHIHIYSISLAFLCKAEDTKQFGFHNVLATLNWYSKLGERWSFCSRDRERH